MYVGEVVISAIREYLEAESVSLTLNHSGVAYGGGIAYDISLVGVNHMFCTAIK